MPNLEPALIKHIVVSLKDMYEIGTRSAETQYVLTIHPQILWICIAVVVIIFFILSGVIMYHWYTYGYASKTISRVTKIYGVGAVFFIAVAISGAIMYTLSL